MSTKRKTVFDGLIDKNKSKNIFTDITNLTNEASVEKFFLDRLIDDLGYQDKNIKVKESIEKLQLSKGSKKYHYKPDYVLNIRNISRLVIDAKSPDEDITEWVEQCVSYATVLNRRAGKQNIKYFLLSNGLVTHLYSLEKTEPILELKFGDFFVGSIKYTKLQQYISKSKLGESKQSTKKDSELMTLQKIDKEDAQRLFVSCHNKIWKSDKMNPQSAFMEFTKLICLKLYHDRKLHENNSNLDADGNLTIPKQAVTFSTTWINQRVENKNPISEVQYKNLLEEIEEDIVNRNKKRMFSTNDVIDLTPETIKSIVKKLEKYDLYGIDDDLNGRLFETFLNATMRGRELGQYFTPRSIVKLAVRLADIQVTKKHIDTVFDGCCGTGGFLIEAFANMKNIVNKNTTYSSETKETLIDAIAEDSIFGIDAAKNPLLSRIARINMYLHGDGGSHIYFSDSLDKKVTINDTYNLETRKDIEDLQIQLKKIDGFDVVLTNPPFSMAYSKNDDTEKEILLQYDLAKKKPSDQILLTNTKEGLISGIMFIERYHDLLAKNGKMLLVIDDSILSAPKNKFVREFIRERFLINSIISLHGDAFKMSNSRVKTSLLYLEKKNGNDTQPNIFMYLSTKLGVDDKPITTAKEKIKIARNDAEKEIEKILKEYNIFLKGDESPHSVLPEKILDRLDVKYCLGIQNRFVNKWKNDSDCVIPLEEIFIPNMKEIDPSDYPEKEFKMLMITYDGNCKLETKVLGKNSKTGELYRVKEGDFIMSRYNAFNGSIGIIPKELDGHYISKSYILLNIDDNLLSKDLKVIEKTKLSVYLWAILRTSELRGELLSHASGMGRQTLQWSHEDLGISKVMIPIKKDIIDDTYNNVTSNWKMELEIQKNLKCVYDALNSNFDVESIESKTRFEATKPPQ